MNETFELGSQVIVRDSAVGLETDLGWATVEDVIESLDDEGDEG